MTKFIIKFLLLAVPVLGILGFPFFLMYIGGEFTPPDKVIQIQDSSKQTVYYAPAYNSFEDYYKMQQILDQKPQVLAIGNSKILDIRQEFFNPDVTFYNAGLLAKKIQHFREVLSHIPRESQPKVMIMTLEQTQFNYSQLIFEGYSIEPLLQKQTPLNYTLNSLLLNWTNVYRDFRAHKFTIKQLLDASKSGTKIGILASVQKEGFRKDGSYRNGRYVDHPTDPNNYDYPPFKDMIPLMQNRVGYFAANYVVSQDALNELDALLKECKDRGIYVIAYMPPIAPKMFNLMKDQADYQYMFQIEPKAQPIFKKYGFELYNFTDPSVINAPDNEFFDSVHPGEKTYLRFFIYMAQHSPVLGKLTDVSRLQKALASANNNLEVFGP